MMGLPNYGRGDNQLNNTFLYPTRQGEIALGDRKEHSLVKANSKDKGRIGNKSRK